MKGKEESGRDREMAQRGQQGGGEEKRRAGKKHSCMLLGNNLWSLKAANMADLASLFFHFGESSSSSPPFSPS